MRKIIFILLFCPGSLVAQKTLTGNYSLEIQGQSKANLKLNPDSTYFYVNYLDSPALFSYGKWTVNKKTLTLQTNLDLLDPINKAMESDSASPFPCTIEIYSSEGLMVKYFSVEYCKDIKNFTSCVSFSPGKSGRIVLDTLFPSITLATLNHMFGFDFTYRFKKKTNNKLKVFTSIPHCFFLDSGQIKTKESEVTFLVKKGKLFKDKLVLTKSY